MKKYLFTALFSLLLAGCGQASPPTSLKVITHDSFAISDQLLADFEQESGLKVSIIKSGDVGTMTNSLILTKDAPLGDVVFGIDNTFASRAVAAGILQPYTSSVLSQNNFNNQGDSLTAIDFGDVCVNADIKWFADKKLEIPKTLDDLVDPKYRGLTVVENPATSSPGLAFMLATVSAYGPASFANYWQRLLDNDVLVSGGWEDAYFTQFSGSSGAGPRPLVVSYDSSPAAEIRADGKSATVALLDTCFRQTEYAAVLKGAANIKGAQAFIDFLLSSDFQSEIPGSMYMYPVAIKVQLPSEWQQFAPVPADSQLHEVSSDDIANNREAWLAQVAALLD